MKKLLSITLLFLTFTSKAESLEAKSVVDLIRTIQESRFEFKERGKIFGFNSTQSCLWTSKEVAIFKNYCFPVRNYPARGYTIISKEFGMIDLYEEKLPGILKRDIQITQFPEILAPFLSTPVREATLKGLSSLIEKMHHNYFPGCWSTNFSQYSETNEALCSSGATVMNFEPWAAETQDIVMDEASWMDLMKAVESKLQ